MANEFIKGIVEKNNPLSPDLALVLLNQVDRLNEECELRRKERDHLALELAVMESQLLALQVHVGKNVAERQKDQLSTRERITREWDRLNQSHLNGDQA